MRVILGGASAASPGWLWATAALAVATSLTAALYAYSFKLFADASLEGSRSGLVAAGVFAGVLIAAYWTAANFDGHVGFGLVDRTNMYFASRIALLVNGTTGIEQFERADHVHELEVLDANRLQLGGAPRQAITFAQAVLRATVTVALLVLVHPVLLLLPVFGVGLVIAEWRAAGIRARADAELAERRRFANDLFALAASPTAAKEVRLYGLAGDLADRHRTIGAEVAGRVRSAALRSLVLTGAAWLLFVGAFAAALRIVVHAAQVGDVSAGDMLMVVVIAQQIRPVLDQVAVAAGQLRTTTDVVSKLVQLEDLLEQTARGSQPPPDALRRGIEFRDVSFGYPSNHRTVLDGVDLILPAGTTVAVIGENGAGKSTLIKLLARLYEPTSGEILVDGVALAEIDHDRWRQRLCAAFQDFVQFELPCFESVGVGDLPRIADRAAVGDALERGDADGLVRSLPDGLDTKLGSSFLGGVELSGGQWQGIALARGMMRELPLVLVLDEPTASLDAAAEHDVFDRCARAARRLADKTGCITIFVSHRFSTVRSANLIVVVDGGRVIETGTHEDLMAAGGVYAEMFTLQAAAYR